MNDIPHTSVNKELNDLLDKFGNLDCNNESRIYFSIVETDSHYY